MQDLLVFKCTAAQFLNQRGGRAEQHSTSRWTTHNKLPISNGLFSVPAGVATLVHGQQVSPHKNSPHIQFPCTPGDFSKNDVQETSDVGGKLCVWGD